MQEDDIYYYGTELEFFHVVNLQKITASMPAGQELENGHRAIN
jgi:hypothetical protein